MNWTYSNFTDIQAPFAVPEDIIDINKSDLEDTAILSKFVALSQGSTGPAKISITNAGSTKYFDINGLILSEYFNYLDSTVYTQMTAPGVIGLLEQVSTDLFMPDGVYSLWSLDTANPAQDSKLPGKNMYGTHPFVMGMASDNTWFGVFNNLAAAQDWWIANDKTTGNVAMKTLAVGGMGDLYFMNAGSPDEVTVLYHMIVGKPVLTPQWALGWHQCRWGYNDTQALIDVVGNYTKYGIPLDT